VVELLSDASAAHVAAVWKKRSWREHAATTRGSLSCFSSEGDWYLWWVGFNALRCKGGSDEGCPQHLGLPARRVLRAADVEPLPRPACTVLPSRWVVERPLAWFGQNRRRSTADERLGARSEAMVDAARNRLMVRRLAMT
jgi:hypothetical protein